MLRSPQPAGRDERSTHEAGVRAPPQATRRPDMHGQDGDRGPG